MIVQKTSEWHQARKFRLTASDFAAAIGLSPYKSRQQLWREKTGRAKPFETNEAILWGEANECNAVSHYEIEMGTIVRPGGFIAHPEFDWLGASPDGVVPPSGFVECKCPYTQPHEDVPIHYRPQVVGVAAIGNGLWCDFVSWTPGETRVWRVKDISEYWAWMVPLLKDFWKCVTEDTEPKRQRKPVYEGPLTITRIK